MAWPSGDQPGALDFQYPVPKNIGEAIGKSLAPSFPQASGADVEYRSLTPTSGPAGRYRLRSPKGQWFVRVSRRGGDPELERRLTAYQFQLGVNVNPFIVAGKSLNWEGLAFRVDVRPLIKGRHFNGSPNDLRNLSSSLAGCHQVLHGFPASHEIKKTAMARCQRLERIRDSLSEAVKHNSFGIFVENEPWAAHRRDWLAEMANQFDPLQLHSLPDAQCVHGEVHPGNVVFRESENIAVLVDFEESTHLFVPPSWDLAFMVQRFCLRDSPVDYTLQQRLQSVVYGYGTPLPEMAPIMRQIAWFTIATAIDLRASEHISTPVAEYEKFVRLERQAVAYEGVL